jgi:hypothetical protein
VTSIGLPTALEYLRACSRNWKRRSNVCIVGSKAFAGQPAGEQSAAAGVDQNSYFIIQSIVTASPG